MTEARRQSRPAASGFAGRAPPSTLHMSLTVARQRSYVWHVLRFDKETFKGYWSA